MSDPNEKSQQETVTIKQEPSTINKPPSYGTRLVQDKEGIKALSVPRGDKKKLALRYQNYREGMLRRITMVKKGMSI